MNQKRKSFLDEVYKILVGAGLCFFALGLVVENPLLAFIGILTFISSIISMAKTHALAGIFLACIMLLVFAIVEKITPRLHLSYDQVDERIIEVDSTLQVLDTERLRLLGEIPPKVFEVVFFEPNSSSLSQENKKKISGFVLGLDEPRLYVKGYADDTGEEQYNLRLSKDRAINVAKYIREIGQAKVSFHKIEGLGETDPMEMNKNEIARSKNRRVSIEIFGDKEAEIDEKLEVILEEIRELKEEKVLLKREIESISKELEPMADKVNSIDSTSQKTEETVNKKKGTFKKILEGILWILTVLLGAILGVRELIKWIKGED